MSAASRTWTTDTDFNAPGATFTGTEVIGTGVPARVELLKDSTDWKNENPSTNPGALDSPAATFDSRDNLTVLFGGYPYSDKTWEYDHTANTWTEITTTPKPPARQSAGLSFDPVQNVAVMFGGYNDTVFFADTWEFNVVTSTWTGDRVLVWNGAEGATWDPATDRWERIPASPGGTALPARCIR